MYYFRADANEHIGAGHMTRCLTIAQALSEKLFREERTDSAAPQKAHPAILFLCADETSDGLPRAYGFRTQILSTDYRDMESELPQLTVLFSQEKTAARAGNNSRPDTASDTGAKGSRRLYESADEGTVPSGRPAMLIDSYYVTDAYLAGLRAFCRVVLIDDNAERPYPVDCVLNYNLHADKAAYAALYASGGTRIFTGPFFAPVRRQFANRHYQVRQTVRHILILSGGSDPDNAAGRIYLALRGQADVSRGSSSAATSLTKNDGVKDSLPGLFHSSGTANTENAGTDFTDTDSGCSDSVRAGFLAIADCVVTIVCGRYNAHRKALEAYAKKDAALRVLYDVEDMASLMCATDLCVSACGSTTYELCAVGLPFVCYALADNQLPLAAYLDANGPAPFAGAFHLQPEETLSNIVAAVTRLAGDYHARLSRCAAQRELVDGNGAARIAEQIL